MKPSYARTQSKLDLPDLELILALHRGRNLAGAAERLQVDTSTVFRSIKRIEKDLGELLFERSRQGYAATELGLELAGYAERIESQLEQAREAALHTGTSPSGTLRITTTDSVMQSVLLPAMAKFTLLYPEIELELVASNALANLSHRDADIAIRATRQPPEHLIGIRLGKLQAAVYASKAYLEAHRHIPDYRDMDWIALDATLPDHPSQRWRRQHLPNVVPRYRMNSVLSVAGAVIHGMGVGVVPLAVFRDNPLVEIVDGPIAELETELWALAHPDTRQLQRMKVMFEFLRTALGLPA
ncbi:LysR family transcriptional regulator [Massilia sp. BSC265]|uniref:LysR family transcriptional regulator n=1 Tax=Massilia sp. BSC265 TaxID=1549812 RepID=UPI0004E8BCAE|nr:LysR family transcriptional regulator [Massilia sp. BSC265]KFI08915.1 LysR family transcriptional regulator [Massilia sp. BSC265]